MNKLDHLDSAEIFDSWRVVPRTITLSFVALFIWSTAYILLNYFHLPPDQRTVALTAFVSVVLTAQTTALPFIVKIYTDNGRDWNARGQPPATIIQQNNAVSAP